MLQFLALLWMWSVPAFADELPSYDATHCELYVDSFGVGDLSYQGITERALDVEIVADLAQLARGPWLQFVRAGVGLNLRVYTAELDKEGRPVLHVDERHRVVEADAYSAGGTYRVYFPFEHRATGMTSYEEVIDFAFYVDALSIDGETVRLWQKDDGGFFTFPRVFQGGAGSERSLGIGSMHYPDPSSPVYAFKRTCAR